MLTTIETTNMRAITQENYGGAEQMQLMQLAAQQANKNVPKVRDSSLRPACEVLVVL